jgi:peptidyl-prolyl cis-trans isomerase C
MERTASNQNKQNSNKSEILLGAIMLCLFAVVIGLILRNYQLITSSSVQDSSWNAAQMREYANKLKADGLIEQSVKAYEEYALNGGIDKSTRSNIYFSIGEMLMKANKFEDALAYFYKAEIADPSTGLKQEIGTNIVTCLEKSNRALDAEYQMESRTLLSSDTATKKPSGEVMARIKNREITMNEINSALEELPPWMKEAYTKDEAKKLDFVKTYVANELFYEKGVKLGINKDPEIREKAQLLEKEMVIQKVLEREVFSKIKSEEDDLRNYYEVYKDRYTEKPAIKFRYILTSSQEDAEGVVKQIEGGVSFEELAKQHSIDEATKDDGGTVSGWVYETGYIPGVGTDKELTGQLFEFSMDSKAHIIKTEKGFYVAEVTDKKEKRVKSFDEVRQEVELAYRQDKSQKGVQQFMDDILAVKDVAIYSEKFADKSKENDKEAE